MLDRTERPLLGLAVLLGPIALIIAGAGLALLTDEPEPSPITGLALLVVGLLIPVPAFRRRSIRFEETTIHEESSLGPLRSATAHPVSSFSAVEWEMKRPKPVDAGSSHAKTFRLRLVGEGASLSLPRRGFGESEGLADARAIGAAYGWPVRRLVDGEVVESYPAG